MFKDVPIIRPNNPDIAITIPITPLDNAVLLISVGIDVKSKSEKTISA